MNRLTIKANLCRPQLDGVWALRREAMYPERELSFVQLPDDAAGHHLGMETDGQLVSVVSFFVKGKSLQFRKLATAERFRNQGLATRLLQEVFSFAAQHRMDEIWCNARLEAISLYETMNMRREGNTWQANGHNYTIMKKILNRRMEIIPAIDLIDGKCVRLTQGDYNQKTIYNEDPLEVALEFEAAGLRRLHLVDLDGARLGKVTNWKVLERIASRTGLVIDFGGGVKTAEDLRIVLESGAALVTIGSLAVKAPDTFAAWMSTYGADKFLLGADVKNEKIAVAGWLETTDVWIYDFLREYFQKGIRQVFCTDVSKDGKLEGPALDLYRNILKELPELDLIASGGVSNMADVEALAEIGCAGVIIGKAIYENRITLKDLQSFQA
ncbi:1-(5-phosphoribosyl)-5-[(5-phosphoribosylamino)methylideneamino]imidazole-4-carboxamide isomerase [Flavihumibacter petaseus]|uniref:1-(5-phosphoribosyl)-5-[(5-phosphoribosylamino)methylideneamino] imidazole-4-carboxamide isomerase n=1 Tax=Flavihumibacter petaseus NBRC 106054 TaxID=1220578 RepID=A0A0E9N0X3_9BACT|nr:1-(5-phosphoribosyl)-5-[(5-phosphoribosylamino)methylideneamino]imidazole-4-carboxamide isomerase [Flavihumibacter petaseus]GAO43484.1 1-(5-phosphoribosyl)-5-[(5-phosphoribosylamino) methylideneamino] imidazole-4-carboxamide isomerase [Flavihumibacter petaseus NBRC 106054]